MSGAPVKRLLLSGTAADLRLALDRLLVHTTVLGVVEEDGACEVSIEGELPDLGVVEVQELDPRAEPVTGLESDRAIRVGDGMLIRPPWVPAPSASAGIELVVPRAMAFGSGEHGSTQAALCMMERLFEDSFESVADIGTGSGILALYARERGCERVFACDVDPEAVAAARELLPTARVFRGGPDAIRSAAVDVVVANMRTSEIESCIGDILALWSRRGPLVLSGLRPGEESAFDGVVVGGVVGGGAHERVEIGGFVALGWRGSIK